MNLPLSYSSETTLPIRVAGSARPSMKRGCASSASPAALSRKTNRIRDVPEHLRGMHFQNPPAEQAKLISVLRGKILDVAIDVRRGSPTFGNMSRSNFPPSPDVNSLSRRDLRTGSSRWRTTSPSTTRSRTTTHRLKKAVSAGTTPTSPFPGRFRQ